MTNLMTPIFFVFWGLVMALIILLLLRRVFTWRRQSSEERQRQQAAYDAALQELSVEEAASERQKAAPVPSVARTIDSDAPAEKRDTSWTPLTGLRASGTVSAEADNGATQGASPVTSPTGESRRHVIHAEQYQSWSPPESKVWTPPTDQVYQVSWANQSLFHTRDTHFDEPDHIPRVTPDKVPTSDQSDLAFGSATGALAALMPLTDADRTGRELLQAGYYQPHALQNLQATRFALIFVALMGLGTLLLIVPPALELYVLAAMIVVPVLMWSVPRILIQNRGAERKSQLERAMPDTLDMLNMCVSQGLTIPASMRRIARDLKPVYPVLAAELAIVVRQAEVGNLRVALENFAERVDVPEVDSFVSLLNQSEKMGTNVSDALTEYSNTMRESLRQRTDEKANNASFKLMFPTVLFMMPAVFMFLMGPAILEVETFLAGGGLEAIQGATETAGQALGN